MLGGLTYINLFNTMQSLQVKCYYPVRKGNKGQRDLRAFLGIHNWQSKNSNPDLADSQMQAFFFKKHALLPLADHRAHT